MDDWSSFGPQTNLSKAGHGSVNGNAINNNDPHGTNTSTQLFSPQHFFNAVNLTQPKQIDEPHFELEQQADTIDSTTGYAVCFAAASDWIVIGTAFNNLIRWYIGGDQDEKNIITLSNKPEERIFEVFISPNGKHVLVSMTNGALYYIPTDGTVTKPSAIQKFKDIVQSVAWYQYDSDLLSSSSTSAAISAGGNPVNVTNPIQRVMLGTTTGSLWELAIEDQREHSLKKLFELNNSSNSNAALHTTYPRRKSTDGLDDLENLNHPAPVVATGSLSVGAAITGIRVIRAGIDDGLRSANVISPTITLPKSDVPRWHLFFVTSSHEYKLSGGPTFEAMFADPTVASGQLSFIELPGGLLTSNQLTTYTPQPRQEITAQSYGEHLTQSLIAPQSYGWLTAAGVYYAQVDANCSPSTVPSPTSLSTQTSDQFSISERLIEFPKIVDQDAINQRMSSGDGIGTKQHYLQPISILLTQFHIIFLFRQHLSIVNLINGTVVMSCPLPKNRFGATRKLAVDETNNLFWLLTDTHIYEIIVSNEDKDIWRLYLAQGDYDNAYQHCVTPHQAKIVSTAHADALFSLGDYFGAAQQYVRSIRTFEAICMKYLLEYQQYSTNNGGVEGGSSHPTNLSNSIKPDDNTPVRKSKTQSVNTAMPNTLFTSTMSSFFGPNQLTSNSIAGHKLFSGAVNAGDNIEESGANQSALGLVDPSSTSSLSLLVSMSSPTSANNGSQSPTSHTSATGSGGGSYAYLYGSFSLMEKKWSIYAGLKTYLKLMLAHINQSDKTKLTTLASWVIEISVNTLVSLQTPFLSQPSISGSRALTFDSKTYNQSNIAPELLVLEEQRLQLYTQECRDLEELMTDYLDVLHPTTTYQLLSTAGRTQECLFYAKLNQHYRYVFDMYLREKLFIEAIDYLRTLRKINPQQSSSSTGGINGTSSTTIDLQFLYPSSTSSHIVPMTYIFTIEPDIVYRIIPTLLQHHPSELVDLLIETDGLQSTQVLTAMVRSGLQIEFTTPPESVNAAKNGVTTVVDPSKRLLQNTLTQFGINLDDKTNANPPNKNNNNNGMTHKNGPDHDILGGLQNPSNIRSIAPLRGNKSHNHSLPDSYSSKQYLHHVSRYLVILIASSLAPPAAHNLYVAILIQLLDAQRLYNYLIAHKHTTFPNRAFALRLALPHVETLFASVIELCLQLQRFTLAIRFALRYDNPTAKSILKTMTTSTSSVIPASISGTGNGSTTGSLSETTSHTSSNVEQSLWQEYVQLLFSQGLSISQIIQDIRSWFSDDNTDGHGSASTVPLLSSTTSTANNTTLLKILPSLPSSITIADIQSNVITQLVDFNTQLNQLNLDMSALHLTNNNLKYQLHSLQQQIIAISTSQRCDICSQPVMLSPFIYFRCGHVFHLLCCVNTVVDHLNSFACPSTPQATPTLELSYLNSAAQQLAASLTGSSAASTATHSLTKKQQIFLKLLNDIHDDLTTTASLSQTAIQDVDQNFCSDEVMDLFSIQALKHKVLTGTLTQEEELFFVEEYAQQSCCHCGDLMIESIGLSVLNTNNGLGEDDGMDWSL